MHVRREIESKLLFSLYRSAVELREKNSVKKKKNTGKKHAAYLIIRTKRYSKLEFFAFSQIKNYQCPGDFCPKS